MKAPTHPREAERLAALHETGVLDAPTAALHQAVVNLASELCGTPIAAISLLDADRQWFPATIGLDCKQTPREHAFCAHTILGSGPLVVTNATTDARFADNALVTGAPGIRFYAGVPLTTEEDLPLGALCVIDTEPHDIEPAQLQRLQTLAALVSAHLQLSRRTAELVNANASLIQHAADQEGRALELEVATRAAEEANRSKSAFLANMSHEIRTPMTAILGFTELLMSEEDQQLSRGERLDYLATIQRNGLHLLAIINDILDLSRIEADKLNIELIDVRPVEVVKDVIDMMAAKAHAKGLRCEIIFETPVPDLIESDPLRLRQILVNVLANAIKFTEAGQVTMRVSCDPMARLMRFDIVDTGIGLSPEQIGELFAAFQQADASVTRKFGGTGLGLHISQRLATMLGGDVSVRSTQGVGSTFTVTLGVGRANLDRMICPAEAMLKLSGRVPPRSSPAHTALSGLRVLLADDGRDNQRLIAFHLTKAGAQVTTVENGRSAVEALTVGGSVDAPLRSTLSFDLVITDMQMPEMDGYTAARLLRVKGCTLPIVALTAHTMRGDLAKCLAAGCDVYVSKPVNHATLIAACLDAIAKRPKPGVQDAANPDHPQAHEASPQPTVSPTG